MQLVYLALGFAIMSLARNAVLTRHDEKSECHDESMTTSGPRKLDTRQPRTARESGNKTQLVEFKYVSLEDDGCAANTEIDVSKLRAETFRKLYSVQVMSTGAGGPSEFGGG